MASSENTQAMHKCANPACSCSIAAEKEYCSEHCASMAAMDMDSCDCGHPECEAYTEQER